MSGEMAQITTGVLARLERVVGDGVLTVWRGEGLWSAEITGDDGVLAVASGVAVDAALANLDAATRMMSARFATDLFTGEQTSIVADSVAE